MYSCGLFPDCLSGLCLEVTIRLPSPAMIYGNSINPRWIGAKLRWKELLLHDIITLQCYSKTVCGYLVVWEILDHSKIFTSLTLVDCIHCTHSWRDKAVGGSQVQEWGSICTIWTLLCCCEQSIGADGRIWQEEALQWYLPLQPKWVTSILSFVYELNQHRWNEVGESREWRRCSGREILSFCSLNQSNDTHVWREEHECHWIQWLLSK